MMVEKTRPTTAARTALKRIGMDSTPTSLIPDKSMRCVGLAGVLVGAVALIGVDLVTTVLVSIFVLLSIVQFDSIFIDLALPLAALAFISTIALAKYLADEQVF